MLPQCYDMAVTQKAPWFACDAVDERNRAPVEIGSLSRYLQGFIHPRWCKIPSINSTAQYSNIEAQRDKRLNPMYTCIYIYI